MDLCLLGIPRPSSKEPVLMRCPENLTACTLRHTPDLPGTGRSRPLHWLKWSLMNWKSLPMDCLRGRIRSRLESRLLISE